VSIGSALSRSLIGYALLVDRKRNAIATRVTVRPPRGDVGTSYGRLYAELAAVCPQEMPPLILSVEGMALREDLLSRTSLPGLWVELPGDALDRPSQIDLAGALQARLPPGDRPGDLPRPCPPISCRPSPCRRLLSR
jgi:hypothetical protein